MITREQIRTQLDNCLMEAKYARWQDCYRTGKVRDMYLLPDKRILIATDRQSAFDHVLGAIPLKGQVLKAKQGQSTSLLPDSAGSTLMLLLRTLDKLPSEFDLQIKTITVGADSIKLAGSVPDLKDRTEIDTVIDDTPELAVTNWDFTQVTTGSKSNGDKRRTFNMSLAVVNKDAP